MNLGEFFDTRRIWIAVLMVLVGFLVTTLIKDWFKEGG